MGESGRLAAVQMAYPRVAPPRPSAKRRVSAGRLPGSTLSHLSLARGSGPQETANAVQAVGVADARMPACELRLAHHESVRVLGGCLRSRCRSIEAILSSTTLGQIACAALRRQLCEHPGLLSPRRTADRALRALRVTGRSSPC